jgi:hypothetical protein
LGTPFDVFSATTAHQTANALVAPTNSHWESMALITTQTDDQPQSFTWYLGGTLPEWIGTPVVAVVLLENGDVELAQAIGQGVLALVLDGE